MPDSTLNLRTFSPPINAQYGGVWGWVYALRVDGWPNSSTATTQVLIGFPDKSPEWVSIPHSALIMHGPSNP